MYSNFSNRFNYTDWQLLIKLLLHSGNLWSHELFENFPKVSLARSLYLSNCAINPLAKQQQMEPQNCHLTPTPNDIIRDPWSLLT
jgi:hypothetical protein